MFLYLPLKKGDTDLVYTAVKKMKMNRKRTKINLLLTKSTNVLRVWKWLIVKHTVYK